MKTVYLRTVLLEAHAVNCAVLEDVRCLDA